MNYVFASKNCAKKRNFPKIIIKKKPGAGEYSSFKAGLRKIYACLKENVFEDPAAGGKLRKAMWLGAEEICGR